MHSQSQPTVSFAASAMRVSEGGRYAEIPVTLSNRGASTAFVSVKYRTTESATPGVTNHATPGEDFVAKEGKLTFTPFVSTVRVAPYR